MLPLPAFLLLGMVLAAVAPKKVSDPPVPDPKPTDDPPSPEPKLSHRRGKLIREKQIVREYVRTRPTRKKKKADPPTPDPTPKVDDPPPEDDPKAE